MYTTLLVGLGSALGGMARYGCSLWLARLFGETFPWGTLFVNVTGSFVIGFYFALTAVGGRLVVPPEWRVFVMTGICGRIHHVLLVQLADAHPPARPPMARRRVERLRLAGAVPGRRVAGHRVRRAPEPEVLILPLPTCEFPRHAASRRVFIGEADRRGRHSAR